MRKLWIVCVLMLVSLMGCASNPSTSIKPLTKPTVTCSEHAPFEPLPRYPTAPLVTGDPLRDYAGLEAYSSAQSVWAVTVAGIVQRDSIKRNATAQCLDALRAAGLVY